MERRVLMVAYHFPPFRGSSGPQRTLSFSRYLPHYGWDPLIVTAHPRAYPEVAGDELEDVLPTVPVRRAFALDTARHLGIRGRYPGWLALPDRWVTWLLGAVPAGLRLIREYRPSILWSTYPVATAHLIGLILHRMTRIPWVADFRDPMTEIDPVSQQRWPAAPMIWWARQWIERRAVKHCSRAVFVAPTALRIYAERYPDVPSTHWALIPNGYDEESFAQADKISSPPSADGRLLLLHSGILYPSPDRDPTAFFAAVSKLRRAGHISSANLRVVLRGSMYEDKYRKLIQEHGIEDLVYVEAAIPYRRALAEMLSADGLLLFQGRHSNPAIPAKLYEYLRAQRPIFAMVDSQGDTAATLRAAAVGTIVPLDSSDHIADRLIEYLAQIRDGTAPVASEQEIRSHSRKSKTEQLARLFDGITS